MWRSDLPRALLGRAQGALHWEEDQGGQEVVSGAGEAAARHPWPHYKLVLMKFILAWQYTWLLITNSFIECWPFNGTNIFVLPSNCGHDCLKQRFWLFSCLHCGTSCLLCDREGLGVSDCQYVGLLRQCGVICHMKRGNYAHILKDNSLWIHGLICKVISTRELFYVSINKYYILYH